VRGVALAGFPFRELAPERLLDLMGAIGATGLDWWPWNRGTSPLAQFRQAAETAGIEITCVNVPGERLRGDAANDVARQVDAVVAAMDDAVALGAAAVQLYPPTPATSSGPERIDALVAMLRPMLPEASARGLRVLVENNFDHRHEDPDGLDPTRRPTTLRAVLDRVDDGTVGVCYDPANFVAAGVDPFSPAFDELARHIGAVHVKDCRPYVEIADAARPEAQRLMVDGDRRVCLPTFVGEGCVPWVDIVEALRGVEYAGWLTLDPFIPTDLVERWSAHAADTVRKWLGSADVD